ncbi:uncharacterized protein EV420DRAFT_1487659 [Desarmillaria tabescens]|uniref:Uncharacterized protein n=1 Tax=Armillaria tabescens TaxID=1929756 RepID=A0AA39J5K4_ARMTA|nr:uncharacterized protein EV420DRAFT_1487659 [Desarmillaria tabescens]KAK0436064.1 hypothetical protein EV420DRAFT_1487659 [Desarmillaria tabescens]
MVQALELIQTSDVTAPGYSVAEECPTSPWVLLLPSARPATHLCAGSRGCNHRSQSTAGLGLYSVDHCMIKVGHLGTQRGYSFFQGVTYDFEASIGEAIGCFHSRWNLGFAGRIMGVRCRTRISYFKQLNSTSEMSTSAVGDDYASTLVFEASIDRVKKDILKVARLRRCMRARMESEGVHTQIESEIETRADLPTTIQLSMPTHAHMGGAQKTQRCTMLKSAHVHVEMNERCTMPQMGTQHPKWSLTSFARMRLHLHRESGSALRMARIRFRVEVVQCEFGTENVKNRGDVGKGGREREGEGGGTSYYSKRREAGESVLQKTVWQMEGRLWLWRAHQGVVVDLKGMQHAGGGSVAVEGSRRFRRQCRMWGGGGSSVAVEESRCLEGWPERGGRVVFEAVVVVLRQLMEGKIGIGIRCYARLMGGPRCQATAVETSYGHDCLLSRQCRVQR